MFNVLLVDDDMRDVEGIMNNISWADYGMSICGIACNGMLGLSMAIDKAPDIIITDISMPIMNGLDMIKEYKKVNSNVMVIFMTCFEEFDFAKNAIELNANGYVLKPICLEELNQCLKQLAELKMKELNEKIYKKNLEQTIMAAKPLLRNEFYHNLLFGKIQTDEEINEKMDFLGISDEITYYSCMHIELDNYNVLYSDYNARDKYLLIEKVLFCVNELLDKSHDSAAIKMDDKSLAVISFYYDKSCDECFLKNVTLAKYLKEQIYALLQIEVTIGVSEIVECAGKLFEQYALTHRIVESKFYTTGNCVLLASDYVESDDVLQYNFNEIKVNVIDYLTGKDKDSFVELLNRYYNPQVTYSRNHLKSLSYTIVNILQTFLLEKGLNFNYVFGDELLLWEKLSKYETILDIHKWIKNVVDAVSESIARLDRTRALTIAQDIEQYIDEKYAELANVADVAEHFSISASYANAVFKRKMGITIFECLVERKMAAAREMLQDPYCRINEIASRLGYMTPAYFTSVFKLKHNMTPKEYRKKFSVRRMQ